MSFYRTYRPQTIGEIDNAVVRGRLLDLLKKDTNDLPHAFLFTGPKGTGKTTAARLVAKIFNCTKKSKNEGPCGTCDQCVAIAKGNSLDVQEIDAASNRGIDEIRTLREQINLAPVSSEYKIYIIDEVHMLTAEAFNALLKTLEEPPLHAVFVLATTELHKIPKTIKSRCVEIVFERAKVEELVSAMGRIVKKEKINIDSDALQMITTYADGSFRDAAKTLEQLSFQKGKITTDVVRTALSLSEEKLLGVFTDALLAHNAKDALQIMSTLEERGNDIKSFLTDILHHLHRLLVAHAMGESIGLWDPVELKRAIRMFTESYGIMRSSPIPELPIELAIVEFCEHEVIRDTREVIRNEEKTTVGTPVVSHITSHISHGSLTLEKMIEHWPDIIADLKSYNHSISGVLRSARPKTLEHDIVTIEAFYPFHQEKLSEPKTKEALTATLKKLFGEKVKIEVILGKK